jgi:hypothetical protein
MLMNNMVTCGVGAVYKGSITSGACKLFNSLSYLLADDLGGSLASRTIKVMLGRHFKTNNQSFLNQFFVFLFFPKEIKIRHCKRDVVGLDG